MDCRSFLNSVSYKCHCPFDFAMKRTVSEYLAIASADSGYLIRITDAYLANKSVHCSIVMYRRREVVLREAPESEKLSEI